MRTLVSLLFIALLAQSAGAQRSSLIEPPFVRKWTQVVGENASTITVRNGLIYYYSADGLGALDLTTGQRRWSCPVTVTQRIASVVLQGRNLYAIFQTETATSLLVIDVETHHSRTLTQLPEGSEQLEVDAKHLYVLTESGMLKAYSPRSGAPLWARQLGPVNPNGNSLAQLAVTATGIYVGIDDAGEFGVDAKNGKILWHHPGEDAGLYPAIVIDNDVITQTDGLKRLHLHTGEAVWKEEQEEGDAVLVSHVLVASSQKDLIGRSVDNGHVLWQLPLSDAGTSWGNANQEPIISDDACVWVGRSHVFCVTKKGHLVWSRPEPYTGDPAYVDRQRLVTFAQNRLFGYTRGTLPPLPASEPDRRALAKRLASRFEILDHAERQQLVQLVPFSCQPLLARYVEWAQSYDKIPDGSSSLNVLLTEVAPLLLATCTKQDTEAIVAALGRLGPKSDWGSHLEAILQQKGDPSRFIPVFVQNLRKLLPAERERSTALSAVAHSSHPDAVALMLEALRDSKAAPAWRQAAFQHLAGTGGSEGIQAVRDARPKPHPIKPWWERFDLSAIEKGRANLGVKTDVKGRTWMLFTSAVLGNASDLFIVQKLGAEWDRPLFTGAWIGRTFHDQAPKAFRGIPIEKLVATEWIQIFPDDPSLRKDSDGDGLTDLVEARLGTDPDKADTDGDGLSDAVDPCPNAPSRELGDDEKIIAASIEARFFEEDWYVPAILGPQNIKPFKLYGYTPMILWAISGRESELAKMYGGGVNIISFHSPDSNFSGQDKGYFIHYSPDRKTAHTLIRRYSGGLNGEGIEVTLIKVGEEWFVVDLETRYVS